MEDGRRLRRAAPGGHEWERAAAQAATRTQERITTTLTAAAGRSGLPGRQLRRLTLTPDEAALLKARLQGAGVPFVDGLAALDVAAAGSDQWREALIRSARQLESAWIALEQRGLAEERAWEAEASRIGTWRPSPWPRRLLAVTVVLTFLYTGLVLGGFLPVPPGAEGAAHWWWSIDQ